MRENVCKIQRKNKEQDNHSVGAAVLVYAVIFQPVKLVGRGSGSWLDGTRVRTAVRQLVSPDLVLEVNDGEPFNTNVKSVLMFLLSMIYSFKIKAYLLFLAI